MPAPRFSEEVAEYDRGNAVGQEAATAFLRDERTKPEDAEAMLRVLRSTRDTHFMRGYRDGFAAMVP